MITMRWWGFATALVTAFCLGSAITTRYFRWAITEAIRQGRL